MSSSSSKPKVSIVDIPVKAFIGFLNIIYTAISTAVENVATYCMERAYSSILSRYLLSPLLYTPEYSFKDMNISTTACHETNTEYWPYSSRLISRVKTGTVITLIPRCIQVQIKIQTVSFSGSDTDLYLFFISLNVIFILIITYPHNFLDGCPYKIFNHICAITPDNRLDKAPFRI